MPSLAAGDVLVLDRGYPSHGVLQALVADGIDFLIRMPASHSFAAIDALRASGGDDALFLIDPPEGSPSAWTPITVRVARLRNSNGEGSFYFTSLRRQQFSLRKLRELYHMRWEAEEFYKLLKGPYIGQGQLRSKSAEGIRQEIHALVLFLAIARIIMVTAAKANGLDYKSLCRKSAVLGLAAYVTRIFLTADAEAAARGFRLLLRRIARHTLKPRPDRLYPRRSFRPRLRWGPRGRCGG